MANLLGTLRVRLMAETEDFKRGLDGARKSVGGFEKSMKRAVSSPLAMIGSMATLTAVIKSSLSLANEFDNAQRKLGATARLTGTSFEFLAATSKDAQDRFKLSSVSANAFTVELAKLAKKAGELDKASLGLAAFLDIGAARGLTAAQTLVAVKQSILGIDEGTDKLFDKNPSVLYAEFAASIGTTAGKLTDAQKAQAILSAAINDGAKVRGEYLRWVGTVQGQQFLLAQSLEQTQAAFGKALQPALVAIIPLVDRFSQSIRTTIKEAQLLAAGVKLIGSIVAASAIGIGGSWEVAGAKIGLALEQFKKTSKEIKTPPEPTGPPLGDSGGTGGSADAGAMAATRYVESFAAKWEELRHTLALGRLSVTGTEPQRIEEEKRNAFNLLKIEEDRARARHALKDITDAELASTLKEIEASRALASGRYVLMLDLHSALDKERAQLERNNMLLGHSVDMVNLQAAASIALLGPGADILAQLKIREDAILSVYELERQAILENTALTEAQRAVDLERLALLKERNLLEIGTEKTTAKGKGNKLADLGMSVAGDALSGRGVNTSALGSAGGSALGNMIAPGIGGMLGGMLGGAFGGIFGNGEEKPPIIKGLDAIERAQRETVRTISAQTETLLNPLSRLINLPSSFTVPNYRPGLGGNSTTTINNNEVFNIMVTTAAPTPTEKATAAAVERTISDVLAKQRRTQGGGPRR